MHKENGSTQSMRPARQAVPGLVCAVKEDSGCAGQVMFDPYAAALAPVQLPEGYNVVPPREGQNGAPYTKNPPALMGCLSSLLEDFDSGSSARSVIQLSVHLMSPCLASLSVTQALHPT